MGRSMASVLTMLTRKSCGKLQEAYRPRHNLSKCHPVPDRGYPHPAFIWGWGGVYLIQPSLGGYPIRSLHLGDTPIQPSIGEYQRVSPQSGWMGYPLSELDGVTPCQNWMGYPLNWDWMGVLHCGQTDIPKFKHYLPSHFVRGR